MWRDTFEIHALKKGRLKVFTSSLCALLLKISLLSFLTLLRCRKFHLRSAFRTLPAWKPCLIQAEGTLAKQQKRFTLGFHRYWKTKFCIFAFGYETRLLHALLYFYKKAKLALKHYLGVVFQEFSCWPFVSERKHRHQVSLYARLVKQVWRLLSLLDLNKIDKKGCSYVKSVQFNGNYTSVEKYIFRVDLV